MNKEKTFKLDSCHLEIVLLAGGEGKRLKALGPKPLVPLLGKPLIDYTLDAVAQFKNIFCKDAGNSVSLSVVVGKTYEELLKNHLEKYAEQAGLSINCVLQKEPRGTGDALSSFLQDTTFDERGQKNMVLVLCADTPLVDKDFLADFVNTFGDSYEKHQVAGIVAGFMTSNPTGYGRIITTAEKQADLESTSVKIVEEKDASEQEREVNLVNGGIYIFDSHFLTTQMPRLTPSSVTGEYYLTQIFELAPEKKHAVYVLENELKTLGVNTVNDHLLACCLLRDKKMNALLNGGVLLEDPGKTYVDWDVSVGPGTFISASVHLKGKTTLGQNCKIDPFVTVKNSTLGDEISINSFSHIEESIINDSCTLGPFARLRPQTALGEKVKIGNFVEVKKSKIDRGAKINHLSYVGDAEVGEDTNIGCGFVTCNYDGEKKHKSKIGKNVFIGSDSQVVAPIEIEDNSFIGAGSTINQNVPEGSFAIARSKQITKKGMAKRFLKSKEKKV